MNCNDPVYQGYHQALQGCKMTGGLPMTGANLVWFVVMAIIIVFAGVLLWRYDGS